MSLRFRNLIFKKSLFTTVTRRGCRAARCTEKKTHVDCILAISYFESLTATAPRPRGEAAVQHDVQKKADAKLAPMQRVADLIHARDAQRAADSIAELLQERIGANTRFIQSLTSCVGSCTVKAFNSTNNDNLHRRRLTQVAKASVASQPRSHLCSLCRSLNVDTDISPRWPLCPNMCPW